MLSAKCCAFSIANATASGWKSTPRTRQSERSEAIAKAIAPVPVPKSKIRLACAESFSNAFSTRHSVSGRGISVAGETFKGSDQNSLSPTK